MHSRRYRKSQNFYEVARQLFLSAHVLSQPKRYAMIMVVMVPREPRETWTDERLNDRFDRLDKDIRELRGETRELRTEMNARFDEMNGRFDALGQMLFKAAVAVIVALVGGAGAIVAALIGVNAF
jgi:hypothetical protein